LVRDVWPYLTAGLLLAALLALTGFTTAALAAAALTAGVAAFFRDPHRDVPSNPRLILSPADGKVVEISGGPQDWPEGARCVSIFLSVFDVHVNRSPVSGAISQILYTPGSFVPAFRHKASLENEQNLISIETGRGTLGVKQIAGLIARRIRCWKRPGEPVRQGERIGFITFGSRVDLLLPPEIDLKVSVGDRVKGGTSVMAVYRDPKVAGA